MNRLLPQSLCDSWLRNSVQQQKVRAGVPPTEDYCCLGCLWRVGWQPAPAWLPSCDEALESEHDALALSPDLGRISTDVKGTSTHSNNGLTFQLVDEHHFCTPRPCLLQRHARRRAWNTQNVTLFHCNYLLACVWRVHGMVYVWRSNGNL